MFLCVYGDVICSLFTEIRYEQRHSNQGCEMHF